MQYGFSVTKEGSFDIVPKIFRHLSNSQRIMQFLVQYNSCVEKNLQIPIKFSINATNIEYAFKRQIYALLKQEKLNFTKANSFCVYSAKLIENFLKERYFDMPFEFSAPKHNAAKLIHMIYAKESLGLSFDASCLFNQYVFNKISKRHLDKKVYLENDIIILENNGKKLLGVMAFFKYISCKKTHLAQSEIRKAQEKLETENLPYLFLVYPRNKEFKKHIEIKSCNIRECKLKLVPYTITNKIF